MNKEMILAHLHLHAVLPRLQELVKLDQEAKRIASEMNSVVRFSVHKGPSVELRFSGGNVTSSREKTGRTDIGMYFTSPEKLNAMFKGEKVIPILYRGFTKIGDLKRFTKLSDMMTRYLEPSDADMQDAEFRAKHVEMLLLTGMNGATVIAEHDQKMQRVAQKLTQGTVAINVLPIGPYAHALIDGPKIQIVNGQATNPAATITIKDVDLAVEMLSGRLDAWAAMAATDIQIKGLLPLADEFNALLDRVGYYLG